MDLITTLITVILVACCILPFIAIARSIKKKKTKLVQSLTKIANQNNCQISEQDFCGNLGIAISEKNSALLFYKETKERETSYYLKLNDILSCTVNNVSRTISSKSGKYQVIDKLELHITFKKHNRPEIVLEFYNSDDNLQLDCELELMEKWAKRIQDELKVIQNQYRLSAAS